MPFGNSFSRFTTQQTGRSANLGFPGGHLQPMNAQPIPDDLNDQYMRVLGLIRQQQAAAQPWSFHAQLRATPQPWNYQQPSGAWNFSPEGARQPNMRVLA